jgi:hypothetical protein
MRMLDFCVETVRAPSLRFVLMEDGLIIKNKNASNFLGASLLCFRSNKQTKLELWSVLLVKLSQQNINKYHRLYFLSLFFLFDDAKLCFITHKCKCFG